MNAAGASSRIRGVSFCRPMRVCRTANGSTRVAVGQHLAVQHGAVGQTGADGRRAPGTGR